MVDRFGDCIEGHIARIMACIVCTLDPQGILGTIWLRNVSSRAHVTLMDVGWKAKNGEQMLRRLRSGRRHVRGIILGADHLDAGDTEHNPEDSLQ